METKIKSVHEEVSIEVQSDDRAFSRDDAGYAADAYLDKEHEGEEWFRWATDKDGYDQYTVRYRRAKGDTRDNRSDGPDWGVLPAGLSSERRHEDAESNVV